MVFFLFDIPEPKAVFFPVQMLRNKKYKPRFYLHNSRNMGRKSRLIFKPLKKQKQRRKLATIPSIPSTSPGAESAQAAGRVAAEAAARAAAGGGFSQLWNSGEVAVAEFRGFARLVDSQWISVFWGLFL